MTFKRIALILLAASLLPLFAAGIIVKGASGYEKPYAEFGIDIENDCFLTIAVRHKYPDCDLSEIGNTIAAKEIPKNPATAMKYALAIYACGVKGTAYDSFDKEFFNSAKNTSALIFALHLKNNGFDTGMTAGEHIKALKERALPSGAFAAAGSTPDVDMTSMAVQALSPHKDEPEAKEIIENALAYMASVQTESGGFKYFGGETSENCSQAIIALSSLGIDVKTDERFIKNGNSIYDALMSYKTEDGFEHTHGGGNNKTAFVQAYCALTAYEFKTPFYVINAPAESKPYENTFAQSGNITVYVVSGVVLTGIVVCAVFLILKKKRVTDYIIIIAVTAAVAVIIGIVGVRTGEGYFSYNDEITVTGKITVSVDCSAVVEKELVNSTEFGIGEGDTAYSALMRLCRQRGLNVVNSGSELSPYIYGIGDIYEGGYGQTSGWAYRVNGKFPSVSSGSYTLKDGDVLEWIYVPDISWLTDKVE